MVRALALCNNINDASEDALKKCGVKEMKQLRDVACSMAKHLDNAIVKKTPCKYNRSTVESSIDSFSHYKFKKHSGLCDHRLSPILDEQVKEAIRAEEGDVAIDMLIPVIDFFIQHDDLDDSYGSGSMFVSSWCDKLSEAVFLLKPGWENDSIVEEALESIESLQSSSSSYGWDTPGLDEVRSKLQRFLTTYDSEGSSSEDGGDESVSKKRRRPAPRKPRSHF